VSKVTKSANEGARASAEREKSGCGGGVEQGHRDLLFRTGLIGVALAYPLHETEWVILRQTTGPWKLTLRLSVLTLPRIVVNGIFFKRGFSPGWCGRDESSSRKARRRFTGAPMTSVGDRRFPQPCFRVLFSPVKIFLRKSRETACQTVFYF